MQRLLSMIFCVGALLYSTAATAKTPKPAGPLDTLYACASVVSDIERLACYDQAAAQIQTAEGKQEFVTIDAGAAKKLKREAFGFHMPSLPKLGLPSFGSNDGDAKKEGMVFAVQSVKKRGRKYVITLKNGQVWSQTSGRLNYVPKGDLTATIKPKSAGSFSLSLNNGKTTVRGLKVRRIK